MANRRHCKKALFLIDINVQWCEFYNHSILSSDVLNYASKDFIYISILPPLKFFLQNFFLQKKYMKTQLILPYMERYIVDNISWMAISLDGFSEQRHWNFRGLESNY